MKEYNWKTPAQSVPPDNVDLICILNNDVYGLIYVIGRKVSNYIIPNLSNSVINFENIIQWIYLEEVLNK